MTSERDKQTKTDRDKEMQVVIIRCVVVFNHADSVNRCRIVAKVPHVINVRSLEVVCVKLNLVVGDGFACNGDRNRSQFIQNRHNQRLRRLVIQCIAGRDGRGKADQKNNQLPYICNYKSRNFGQFLK